MKKLFSLIVFAIVMLGANAQIHVASNGNVGIKTTSPEADLSVNGIVKINGTSTPEWGSAIRTIVSDPDACAYHLYNTSTTEDVFFVHASGYLWCKLGGFFGSDINMKQDIRDIDSPLTKVTQLHGVKYKYKDTDGIDIENKERMGLIAQEVEEIVPEVVKEMNNGTKAIAYTDLIGLLVEAMKEQQTQIEELKKQVEKLSATEKN